MAVQVPPRFSLQLPRTSKQGDAIIVAFNQKWNLPLQRSAFSVVIRKMHPFRLEVKWMYAYLTRPISAIIAKIPIHSVEKMYLREVMKLAKQSMHTVEEIQKYSTTKYQGEFSELVVYQIGKAKYAKKPVTMRQLADDYGYWPSSTFIPLSHSGSETLDRLGGF